MTEIYVNLCENKPIQHLILVTTPVTHDTQLEWYACYAAGTQMVRSWYAAGTQLVSLGTHWYARFGTHWYALVRIWYASGTHLVRSFLVRMLLIWYAFDTHLVRSWYASGTQLVILVRILVRTDLVRTVRTWYAWYASGTHLVRIWYAHLIYAYQIFWYASGTHRYARYALVRTEQFADGG
jgi:hypothetical protein